MMERCWNRGADGHICGNQATHFDADTGQALCEQCAALRSRTWAVVERRLYSRRVVRRGLTAAQAVDECHSLNRWHPSWPTDLFGYFAHTEAELAALGVEGVAA